MNIERQRYDIEAKKKQTLRSLLTQEQITEFQNGNIVAMHDGDKLKLDDEVKGIVLVLSPLQGG